MLKWQRDIIVYKAGLSLMYYYNYLNGLKALSLVMLFAKQNEAESSHF